MLVPNEFLMLVPNELYRFEIKKMQDAGGYTIRGCSIVKAPGMIGAQKFISTAGTVLQKALHR